MHACVGGFVHLYHALTAAVLQERKDRERRVCLFVLVVSVVSIVVSRTK